MDRVALLDQAQATGRDVSAGITQLYALVLAAGHEHDDAIGVVQHLVDTSIATIQAWREAVA